MHPSCFTRIMCSSSWACFWWPNTWTQAKCWHERSLPSLLCYYFQHHISPEESHMDIDSDSTGSFPQPQQDVNCSTLSEQTLQESFEINLFYLCVPNTLIGFLKFDFYRHPWGRSFKKSKLISAFEIAW